MESIGSKIVEMEYRFSKMMRRNEHIVEIDGKKIPHSAHFFNSGLIIHGDNETKKL